METQLSKTGGTPYRCAGARSLVEKGLSVPLSALNSLRRQVLDELTAQRSAPPQRRQGEYKAGVRYENRRQPPVVTISLRRATQLTFELQKLKPALVYLPAEEIAAHPDVVGQAMGRGVSLAVTLPRICLTGAASAPAPAGGRAWGLGITQALTGNLGLGWRGQVYGICPPGGLWSAGIQQPSRKRNINVWVSSPLPSHLS